jgi:hypothetical protein
MPKTRSLLSLFSKRAYKESGSAKNQKKTVTVWEIKKCLDLVT